MTNEQMIQKLDQATSLIGEVRTELAGPPPDTNTIFVPAGTNLQTAIDNAADGSTLQLDDATFVQSRIKITKRISITRRNPVPLGCATADAPCWIRGSDYAAIDVRPEGSLTLFGVGIKNDNPDGDLIDEWGTGSVYDGITGLGDPINGQRRGILLHGNNITIADCYFDHIFRPGRDTCVLGGYDGGNGITISGSYLCGGAETIMFGGGDNASAERNPKNIHISHCTLTKRPEWYSMGMQLKNAFELKNAEHVVLENCKLEYAGVSEGQGAYLIVLTVRNQNNKTPWAQVVDVKIENCQCSKGGGGVTFLGYDDNYPSGKLDGCLIRNVSFTEMNSEGLWSQSGTKGSGRCAFFHNAPKNVTMEAITMDGVNMSALGYFSNTPKQPVGLTLKNWKYCTTKYGWKIDAGSGDVPPASTQIKKLMPDLVYEVTASDPGAI